MRRVSSLALASLLLASPAFADTWDEFVEARRGSCVGGPGSFEPAREFEVQKHRYRLEGHRLVQLDKDADNVLRIGVISALKDDRAATREHVRLALDRFLKEGVDLIIANGDLATTEFDMEGMFKFLAAREVLFLALIGNTESCGSFNRAATEAAKDRPSFINGNWVRRLELDDGTVITLPGYYDRKFAHTGGAAQYKEKDLELTRDMIKDAPGPVVLTSHGPPHQEGPAGIDLAHQGGNVGDPAITEMIAELKIPFGIFGHILEAGGRGADLAGKAAAPGKWHKALYVNAGTLNPDPWKMLDGKASTGMALFVEIKGKEARYRVDRLAPTKVQSDD